MPRTLKLTASPSYRAVLLMKFTGLHNLPLRQYTKADGSVIDYHLAEAFGVYNSQASAKAALTRETGYAKHYGKWINGLSSSEIPSEIIGFVEVSETVWKDI